MCRSTFQLLVSPHLVPSQNSGKPGFVDGRSATRTQIMFNGQYMREKDVIFKVSILKSQKSKHPTIGGTAAQNQQNDAASPCRRSVIASGEPGSSPLRLSNPCSAVLVLPPRSDGDLHVDSATFSCPGIEPIEDCVRKGSELKVWYHMATPASHSCFRLFERCWCGRRCATLQLETGDSLFWLSSANSSTFWGMNKHGIVNGVV